MALECKLQPQLRPSILNDKNLFSMNYLVNRLDGKLESSSRKVTELGRYFNAHLVRCPDNEPDFDILQLQKTLRSTSCHVVSIMTCNSL